ncbi:Enolase-phosphatase E1 [Chytriomyces hyalinus]|nr:Enolase-phosphatase E1 [Chytriomyces hyalinus]
MSKKNKVKAKDSPAATEPARPHPYACVVTDIEGTTTSISFVHETLFPYARDSALSFITSRAGSDPALRKLLLDIQQQAKLDKEEGVIEGAQELPDILANEVNAATESTQPAKGKKNKKVKAAEVPKSLAPGAAEAYVAWIHASIKADRKIGALKTFQGYIWKFAYEDGSVKGHVYKDVKPILSKWNSLKIPVYIYSSGSIGAQKLLFGFSEEGDMLPHFAGHFDTTIGLKLEAASYTKIADEISTIPASKILFLSDNVKEIEAANQSGFQTAILFRPGNPPLDPPCSEPGYYVFPGSNLRVPVVETFDELFARPADFTHEVTSQKTEEEQPAVAVEEARADENAENVPVVAGKKKQISEPKQGSRKSERTTNPPNNANKSKTVDEKSAEAPSATAAKKRKRAAPAKENVLKKQRATGANESGASKEAAKSTVKASANSSPNGAAKRKRSRSVSTSRKLADADTAGTAANDSKPPAAKKTKKSKSKPGQASVVVEVAAKESSARSAKAADKAPAKAAPVQTAGKKGKKSVPAEVVVAVSTDEVPTDTRRSRAAKAQPTKSTSTAAKANAEKTKSKLVTKSPSAKSPSSKSPSAKSSSAKSPSAATEKSGRKSRSKAKVVVATSPGIVKKPTPKKAKAAPAEKKQEATPSGKGASEAKKQEATPSGKKSPANKVESAGKKEASKPSPAVLKASPAVVEKGGKRRGNAPKAKSAEQSESS